MLSYAGAKLFVYLKAKYVKGTIPLTCKQVFPNGREKWHLTVDSLPKISFSRFPVTQESALPLRRTDGP
jgi:hypothetical protein